MQAGWDISNIFHINQVSSINLDIESKTSQNVAENNKTGELLLLELKIIWQKVYTLTLHAQHINPIMTCIIWSWYTNIACTTH